jgi:hypothetical protein
LNKTTRLVMELLAADSEAVVRRVIEDAKAGQPTAQRLVVERLAAVRRSHTILFKLPPIQTVEDIPAAMATVVEGVCAGRLTLEEGEKLIAMLVEQRISLEGPDMELRVRALEARQRGEAHAQVDAQGRLAGERRNGHVVGQAAVGTAAVALGGTPPRGA